MYTLTPQKIAEITNSQYIGSDKMRNISVVGAVRDNRDVKPGNLFVCIRGKRTDGHLFANDAYERGAACCLAEQKLPDTQGAYVLVKSTLEAIKTLGKFYRSQFNIPVVGITGSVGKTTTKELIAAALGAKLNVLKTEMNLNNELGVPLTLLSLGEKHEAAVIEMGISDFGEMSSLAIMAQPTIFVITKIGYSHIKELGDLYGVLRAKTEAFAYMKPEGTAVMNGDDELLLGCDPKMGKITFGLGKHNDFRAENIRFRGVDSIAMDIVRKTKPFSSERNHIEIPAYGNHIAELAASAVAVARLLGLTYEDICRGLLQYTPIDGRSVTSVINGITIIDDCYNANPNSVKAALESLSELSGRRVAILGDMLNLGSFSEKLHHDVGSFAADCGVDVLLCCGEEAREIYAGYKSSGGIHAKYYSNIDAMIYDIRQTIKKGDAVLVKASRGIHFEKIVGYVKNM